MSYEHTDLFKQLGDDLERWTKSVRKWEKISTKNYTLDELYELEREFRAEYHSVYRTGDSWFESPKQFLDWLKERESKNV